MNDLGDRMKEEVNTLRRIRDELRVQLALGEAEVRDRWELTEKRWHELEGRMKVLREASRAEAKEIGAAARLLLDEIREGYEHLRKSV
jgi:hypothetical protein